MLRYQSNRRYPAKEPCKSAKEPYICGKVPCISKANLYYPSNLRTPCTHRVSNQWLYFVHHFWCMCVSTMCTYFFFCEYIMSHMWIHYVTHMSESCRTCGCVVSLVWISVSHMWLHHVTHVNESCRTHEWVMSHTWTSHTAHVVESCGSHMWIHHVTHMKRHAAHVDE